MKAHLALRKKSTENDNILKWLSDFCANEASCKNSYSLLSIGSGSGVLEVPLISNVRKVSNVNFVGVDPNRVENEECRKQLETISPGCDGNTNMILDTTFEEFEETHSFDTVIAVHSHYYFDDLSEFIAKALRLLHTDGKLVVVSGINEDPLRTYQKQASLKFYNTQYLLSDDIISAVQKLGASYECHTINSWINGQCFDESPTSSDSNDLLNFLIHADSSGLDQREHHRVLNIVLDHAVKHEGRLYFPHVVKAIVVYPGTYDNEFPPNFSGYQDN